MNALPDLDELTRKNRRREFKDGLVDLLNAVVYLFFSLLFAFIYSSSGLLWYVLMVGFLISIIEPNTWLIILWLGTLFQDPDLINLHQYMPSYNISSVNSWIRHGHALSLGPIMSVTTSFET